MLAFLAQSVIVCLRTEERKTMFFDDWLTMFFTMFNHVFVQYDLWSCYLLYILTMCLCTFFHTTHGDFDHVNLSYNKHWKVGLSEGQLERQRKTGPHQAARPAAGEQQQQSLSAGGKSLKKMPCRGLPPNV
jgi:hypothetical protein